jgi:hypothetical protein
MNALLKQINLLNVLLAAIIIAVIVFVLVPVFSGKISVPVITMPAAEEQKSEFGPQPVTPPFQDYAVVAEKNLFHPGRIVPPEKKDEAVQRPEFVLYGTLIDDRASIAYISDNRAPRTTPGRGKRQTGLKLGQTMSGYILKEVLHDRVIMVRGDDKMEVKLIAPGGRKNRGSDASGPAAPAPAKASSPPSAAAPGAVIPPAAPSSAPRPDRTPSRTPRNVSRPAKP